MPNKKAAKEFMRSSKRKKEQNIKIKEQMKALIRETRKQIEGNHLEKARELFKKAVKAIDKAGQKKVIKKNSAARKKSRLNKKIKALKS